jgi:hypothetical protein
MRVDADAGVIHKPESGPVEDGKQKMSGAAACFVIHGSLEMSPLNASDGPSS